jgi:3-methyladenine DNA glycosylase AlkD
MKGRLPSSSIQTKRSKSAVAAPRKTWTVRAAMAELRRCGDRRNVEGMARFGIRAEKLYGASKPQLDVIARRIGKNHRLGMALRETGIMMHACWGC